MTERAAEALRAWFLGPKAENADLLERLVVEAIRDHVFWRRNHHPEDPPAVHERDKRASGYEDAVGRLTQELLALLAELKRGVPFFSGRYQGHMLSEQTIAAQVGYLAAMLYNPNNVSAEASPVTTRLELEVSAQLSRMIGYDPATAWGHLTSGGTVANFEALWVARSGFYVPVAVAGAARELGVELPVRLPDGETAPLESLPLERLLNVRPADALDLWGALWQAAPTADVRRALDAHSLQAVGYQDYGRRLAFEYGDPLPASVVLVAATAHYSWEKIVRALGIGSNQLVYVPVDHRFRMDPDALWATVRDLTARRVPILACVSVCGTTEEGAVDRLDEVLEVRECAEEELQVSFHLHSDACYGGYAAAVTRRADGTRRSAEEARRSLGAGPWPSEEWMAAMGALAEADSVTIDPHKLGYVPYPAGAILMKDRRARDLIAADPPYLTPARGTTEAQDLFLGRYILEGSKPGATAAAVWLTHHVIPLDERGYGHLIGETVRGAQRLRHALAEAELDPVRVVLLPESDLNIVCFVVLHPACATLAAVNALNEGVYARCSQAAPGASPSYYLTRTRLTSPHYDGAIAPLLDAVGVTDLAGWQAAGDEGLVVLRSTVMDPFLAGPEGAVHTAGLAAAVREAALAVIGATA